MGAPESNGLGDEGATPLRLAAEANSTANHVREDFRDYRAEQAKTNRSLVELISNVDRRVGFALDGLSTLRGELEGQSKQTKHWLTIGGLAVGAAAAVVPIVLHFLERR